MVVCSGLSLDRADKLASIFGLFVTLAGFLIAYRTGHGNGADHAGQPVDPEQHAGIDRLVGRLRRLLLGGPRIPLVAAVAATVAVGLISVTITYFFSGPDRPTASEPVAPSPSVPQDAEPPASASMSPTVADCPLPGSPATASPSAGTVLRRARMTLPAHYYADLDSTCPNWGITRSNADSSVHDIVNDGTGVFHGANTEIARVPAKEPATYEMCLGNTDYLASTVMYDRLKPGDRYCVKTIDGDSGRQSLVTIVAVQRSGSTRTVVMDVQTWALTEPREQNDDDLLAIAFWVFIALMVLGGGSAAAGQREESSKKNRR